MQLSMDFLEALDAFVHCFIGVEKLRRVKHFKKRKQQVVGQCLLHLFVSLFFC